ncbi:STAS domain-containing protein [Lentzea sp. BCCO 10_0061]|uniref:Anti-sigma factor antagonist n=1 Tax=Lentzea sokolovensis TaxID=3095429 RepID=A0ABU4VAS0_9PSEU|nr:STAS domain-containing protein [Lentzea sp. BCCO 10_0061]MDX8148901.1 STAS domain-containing protein [Lentzea sp. BCCO 10_0061]
MNSRYTEAVDALTTQIVDHDGVVIVVLAGEVDMATGSDPLAGAIAAVKRTSAGLVVDLNAVTFFGSSGINLLVAARQHAQSMGVPFAVVADRPAVLKPLAMTGMDVCLAPFPSVPDALTAIRAQPSVPPQSRC